MIADFPKQLEMHFWDLAIPAMTENKFIQKVIRTSYGIIKDTELRSRSLWILGGCVAGFLAGLFTYIVII